MKSLRRPKNQEGDSGSCLTKPPQGCSDAAPSHAPGTPPSADKAAPLHLENGGRVAYLTLLTSSALVVGCHSRDSYLMGVQALHRSLRRVGAAHPLVVMHTPTLSSQAVAALAGEGCEMLLVEPYLPADGAHDPTRYKLSHYADCWSKLRMWEQAQFRRLVYLDADMLVARNIDHLFDLPGAFYAVGDCAYGRATEAERRACSLFHPDRPAYFNAGFFCMSPSRAEFARFGHLLSSGLVKIGGFAEQDFLNGIYQGQWTPLPWAFNAQKGILRHHPGMFKLEEAAVIHYTDAKPWQRDHPSNREEGFRDLVRLWWEAYERCPGLTAAPAAAKQPTHPAQSAPPLSWF